MSEAPVDIRLVTLVHPMPGFPDQLEFRLVRLDDGGPLARFESLDSVVRFLVVPAVQFHPGYAPVVDDEVVADLGIDSADDVLVLLIVHAAASLEATTVNLRAPLLVNAANRRAAQVILEDPTLELAAPLLR